jgi:hypothetical protein
LRPNVHRIAISALLAGVAGCHCCATHPESCPATSPSTGPAASAAPSAPGNNAPAAVATAPAQETFASPEEAAAALKEAVRERDRDSLLRIFGPDGQPLIFSGDRVQDDNRMGSFEQHMAEQLRVDHPDANRAVLYIGSQNWPFPIPVVNKNRGQWSFDTAAGKDEILNRRIGRNELSTIDVCQAFVRAQKEYAEKDRVGDKITQYAQHFRSSDDKHDGLYWKPTTPDDLSPMNDLVADAEAEGYSQPPLKSHRQPYHGYFYHILTAQGADAPGGKMNYLADGHLTKGFALVAYPDEWGNSGVMTFIVNQDGKVYQKNLGPQTSEAAAQITEYDPDSTWQEVKE